MPAHGPALPAVAVMTGAAAREYLAGLAVAALLYLAAVAVLAWLAGRRAK